MQGIPYNYTKKEVSPWGGLRLIEEAYRRSGLKDYLTNCEYLPEPGSNRGYKSVDLIEMFMASIILGAKRLAHTGNLRYDSVVGDIFGWDKGIASQSTFSRFFKKFDKELNDMLFPSLNEWWFSQLKLDKYTIDIDSTVLTRFGEQEGTEIGFNPKKPGRRSHHPLLAFAAEAKMVVNAWMRTGDSASGTDFFDFFQELLTIIPRERIGLIRADSGFFADKILSQIEQEDLKYIVSVKMTPSIVGKIFQEKDWFPVKKGIWSASFEYQAHGWKAPRRVIIIRKNTDENPKTSGKLLFPEISEFEKYKYSAFVTNVGFSSKMVWDLYRQRADAENRIKELKYDYGIEGFCLEDFYATEAAFRFSMVAYNLMSLFKLQLLNKKPSPMLSSLRFQCIAIGSYIVKSARKRTLMLSAKAKKQQFLETLFQKLNDFSPPFKISIA